MPQGSRESELQRLAWRASYRTPGARLQRVASLARLVRQGAYQVDADKLSEAVLHPGDLNLAALLCRHPALVAEHVNLYGGNGANDLLVMLETRDRFTGHHCVRVTAIALRFARYLGLAPRDLEMVKTAGYLHDLGKAVISPAILRKKDRLTPREQASIEDHPAQGVRLAQPLRLVREEREIILHHHEWWDGRGYPQGLAGEQIPPLSRLVALADAFEALTSDRPYRARRSPPEALQAIQEGAGSQFDPFLAREFLRLTASAGL